MTSAHIADGYKMIVEIIAYLVNNSGIAKVKGTSFSLSECRNALAIEMTDILILGLNMPDGDCIDYCRELREEYPDLKIIILTANEEYHVVNRLLNNGVNGYILKTSMAENVLKGIQAVINGERFICDEIIELLEKERGGKEILLSKRELDILRLIVEGYTSDEIAKHFMLSVETIKTNRKRILSKLGAKNSMALVKKAIEMKLI